MKVSSQILSVIVFAGFVAANERGRQNDWHKVTKPNKFKPNAPRNEGKVLREDRKAEREARNAGKVEEAVRNIANIFRPMQKMLIKSKSPSLKRTKRMLIHK